MLDELRDEIATAMEAHHLDPDRTDAMGNHLCTCRGWADAEGEDGWDQHMADVTLRFLTERQLVASPEQVAVVRAAAEWRKKLGSNREIMVFGNAVGAQSQALVSAVDAHHRAGRGY